MAAITMTRRCEVDGCENAPIKYRPLCGAHRSRLQRHGDVGVVLPKGSKPGSASTSWRNNAVKYNAAHSRVRAERGNASLHSCIDCGSAAGQWSLRHDAEVLEVEGRRFSLNVDEYEPRCVTCHVRYDRKGR